MDKADHGEQAPGAKLLAWSTAALLVLSWILGGVTQDSTSADEILQLLALPVLMLAVLVLLRHQPAPLLRVAVMLAVAIVALPALQLLSIPASIANLSAARHAIQGDLAIAAVVNAPTHLGVSRFVSERALWSLLPALAVFLGMLALPQREIGRMLTLVLVLALASAVFAFFQLSLPDGSSLLLYTEWGRNFGGAFANPNHQGTALSMAAVISAALFIQGRRIRKRQPESHRYWLYAFLCMACVAMVPLANGSAAMLLVISGILVVVFMSGALDMKAFRSGNGGRLALVAMLAAMLVLAASAFALQKSETDRRIIAATTLRIGAQFAPTGAGVGTFVPIYGQYQDLTVARSEVINHAHNEYVQWWLEGGVIALLVLAAGLGLFVWAGWQALARTPSSRLRTIASAAWTSLLVLLMHSLVDFPLRTSALMATAGLLAGLLFNVLELARQEGRARKRRDEAAQRA